MRSLDEIAQAHDCDKRADQHDYCRHYEKFFGPMRYKPIRLLEIGVQFGFSMGTWLEYFPNAQIVGVDINEECCVRNPRLTIVRADAGGPAFASSIRRLCGPPFDIVIDDGAHTPHTIRNAFDAISTMMNPNSFYCIEDLQTDYNPEFCQDRRTGAVHMLKDMVDTVNWNGVNQYNSRHSDEANKVVVPNLCRMIDGLHFYKGLAILEFSP